MPYFLALDAGGTKTDYVLADETRILARVRSGTIKRMRTSHETAASNLDGALRELTQQTGIPMSAVSRTCVGTAGNSVPLVADWLREEITARVAGEFILTGDVDVALDAAFPGAPGILVLAGTGSNVAGRTAEGIVSTTGGWGPALADQGSGHWIGLHALRAAFLARDEDRDTSLFPAIMSFWNLENLDALIEFANSNPPPDFSRLVPLVAACAAEGDIVAIECLHRQGIALGHLVRLLIRRLQKISDDAGFIPQLAFAGSIMENLASVREALIDDVQGEFPGTHAIKGVVDPIEGALWQARTGGKR